MPQLVVVSVSTGEGIDGNYISYLIPAKAVDHAAEVAKTILIGRDTYDVAGFGALHQYLSSTSGFYVRTLAEYAGGVTQLLKSAHACEAFGHNYEIHSYGPPLNLAMYLNVALPFATATSPRSRFRRTCSASEWQTCQRSMKTATSPLRKSPDSATTSTGTKSTT